MAVTKGTTPEDEKNRKNAHILKVYCFRHELWKVVQFGFNMFNMQKHSIQLLEDLIYLNHLMC